MTMFAPGDKVVATRNGGKDRKGRPYERPGKGRLYTITSIYKMHYGLGCTLEGLDPRPYRGYYLVAYGEFYFRKVVKDKGKADESFIKLIKEKHHEDHLA